MPSSKTRSTIGHLVLTTELKRKLAAVQSLKADVSSVSPSSVRLKELWVVCGFICRKWSYHIGGNMATTLFPTSRHFWKLQNTSTKMYLPNGRSKSPRYQWALFIQTNIKYSLRLEENLCEIQWIFFPAGYLVYKYRRLVLTDKTRWTQVN